MDQNNQKHQKPQKILWFKIFEKFDENVGINVN